MDYRWLDISEYSRVFKISISTIRRKIKKGELEVRKTEGKYLIKTSLEHISFQPKGRKEDLEYKNAALCEQVRRLQQEIQRA